MHALAPRAFRPVHDRRVVAVDAASFVSSSPALVPARPRQRCRMLKWLLDAPRLIAVAFIFATLVATLAQPNKSIILNVKPGLSLTLSDAVVTRDCLVARLQATTNGDRNERIYVRADEGVRRRHLMAVAIAIGSAGYFSVAVMKQPVSQTCGDACENNGQLQPKSGLLGGAR
jgi:biopolymer transport protein ExbD